VRGIFFGRLFEDRRERGTGVLGIDVDASAEDRLLADVSAGEIELALDREMSFGFDLLRDDLAENQLLGKVFGSHDDAVGTRRPTGCEEA